MTKQWKAKPYISEPDEWYIINNRRHIVAGRMKEANAKQITRDHNCHDDLVKACENLAYELNSTPESGPVCWCNALRPGGTTRHALTCLAMQEAFAKAK